MKRLFCPCGNTLYFENTRCLACTREVAFLPDRLSMGAIVETKKATWRADLRRGKGGFYRKCRNAVEYDVCNWMVPEDDPSDYCRSCRLNRIIPNLDHPGNKKLWFRIEQAKRLLIYSILNLGLPLVGRGEDPDQGLAFQFLEDPEPVAEFSDDLVTQQRVTTGHAAGVITINIREADPRLREETRQQMGEQYRTLLGHFRHEIGHFYWDRLIAESRWLGSFRTLFGDERRDYESVLSRYYAEGPPRDWPTRFVSPYAASHPWEDWGETWAHYFHMIQTLETADACGFVVRDRRPPRPKALLHKQSGQHADQVPDFQALVSSWIDLTLVLNALNRSMGMPDAYPFTLSIGAIEKIRFVHDVIAATLAADRRSTTPTQNGAGV